MAQEITTAAQKTPRVGTLYLPQIYWMILANHKDTRISKENAFRLTWESRYLATLAALGIVPWLDPSKSFWDDGVDLAPEKINVQQTFQNSRRLLRLCSDAKTSATPRIDQTVTPYCEAIGLSEFGSDFTPTDFFISLVTDSGEVAAVMMLARYLSIPYSTLKYVKLPPAQLILKASESIHDRNAYTEAPPENLTNQSVQTYALAAYTQAIAPFIPDNYPSAKDRLPSDLLDLSRTHFDQTISDWRHTPPKHKLQRAIAAAIVKRIEGIKESNALAVDIKEKLIQRFNTTAIGASKMVPRNIIVQGPPGTGKSLVLEKIAARLADGTDVDPNDVESLTRQRHYSLPANDLRVIHVQFHPSYGYEDFVEGIRPVENKASKDVLRFTVVPGPLRAIAEIARAYYEAPSGNADAYKIRFLAFVKWSQEEGRTSAKINLEVASEFALYRIPDRDGEISVSIGGQLVVVATSGAGKIVPKEVDPSLIETFQDLLDHESYAPLFWNPKIRAGDDATNFVLKIDELNRGNPAKIFGELLSLIEVSKRLGSKSMIQTTLPVSRMPLAVPPNLHFLAAMNLADRSLAVLDQAFRRRFSFVSLYPDWDIVRDVEIYKLVAEIPEPKKEENERVASFFENINKALGKVGVSDVRHIGHSYALQALSSFYMSKTDSAVRFVLDIWRSEIHSLLRDILEDDVEDFIGHYEKITGKESPLGDKDPVRTLLTATFKQAS